jgi:hypothetical protein
LNIEGPTSQTLPPTGGYAPASWQPASSPLRISAGVVGLVLSVVGIVLASALLFTKGLGPGSPFLGWMNFFLIVGSIGCLVTGIVIIAKQRKRGGATPWLVATFAALAVIACIGMLAGPRSSFPGFVMITLPVALATGILAVLVIVRDKTPR